MKTNLTKTFLPILWFLVAVATLIHYERHWETGSSVFFDGFGTGIGLAAILAIALVIRIFRRVEDILIAKGTIKRRVSTPYDVFPLLLLIPFSVGGQWFGDLLPPAASRNEVVYEWFFKWGTNDYKFVIYLAVLGLILLYRIHQLLVAVLTKEKEPT
jgi:hypothetical protein